MITTSKLLCINPYSDNKSERPKNTLAKKKLYVSVAKHIGLLLRFVPITKFQRFEHQSYKYGKLHCHNHDNI